MDLGDNIIYTGQGGRAPGMGQQVAHQQLNRGNLALAKSKLHGLPVRVIRRFDYGGFSLADDLSLIGLEGVLTVHPRHKIDLANVQYHREHYFYEQSES